MRISDWSSDVCSSDLRGSRIVGGRVVPRCSKRRSLFNTGLDRHLGASRDGGSINLIIGTATARTHRGTCRVDFALQKLVVLPRLDRKTDVWGKSVTERVDLGGRRLHKKKKLK